MLRTISVSIACAVLLWCGFTDVFREGNHYRHEIKHPAKEFLLERSRILNYTYSDPNEDLDAEIESFALPRSKVRNASTLNCKREIVHAHRRAASMTMPRDFTPSCPDDTAKDKTPVVFFIDDYNDLSKAGGAMRELLASEEHRNATRFVLLVDDAALLDSATRLAALFPNGTVHTVDRRGGAAQGGSSSYSAWLAPPPTPRRRRPRAAPTGNGHLKNGLGEIRIAYSIFVSPNDPPWRPFRLLRSIYTEKDYFFIHVDATVPYERFAAAAAAAAAADGHAASVNETCDRAGDVTARALQAMRKALAGTGLLDRPNVKVEALHDVAWGGPSLVNMMIDCAHALAEMGSWDYWIDLSSTDYPLQPPIVMHTILGHPKVAPGTNFIGTWEVSLETFDIRGFQHNFVECEGRTYLIDDLSPPYSSVRLRSGTMWFALHRSFLDWLFDCIARVTRGLRKDPKADLDFSEYGECGTVAGLLDYAQYRVAFDEIFFQTALASSPFCQDFISNDLRFIDWYSKKGHQVGCLHWEETDWCGSSPQALSIEDVVKARETAHFLFARKIEDPAVMDELDKLRGVQTVEGMPEDMQEEMLSYRRVGKIRAEGVVNIAFNQLAVASSMQDNEPGHDFPPSNSVDGNIYTRWSSKFQPENQWILIQLSQDSSHPCFISEVVLYWETAHASNYTIEVTSHLVEVPPPHVSPNSTENGTASTDNASASNASSPEDGAQSPKAEASPEAATAVLEDTTAVPSWSSEWRVVHRRELTTKPRIQTDLHHVVILSPDDVGPAQALRLLCTARGTPWGYSLWELEVYGRCGAAPASQTVAGSASAPPDTDASGQPPGGNPAVAAP